MTVSSFQTKKKKRKTSLPFSSVVPLFPPNFAKVVIKVAIPFVIILLENSTIVTGYNNYNILDLTYEA